MLRLPTVLAASLLALALPALAQAVPQTVTVADPADGTPSIVGQPRPDLASVTVTHDTDTATATVVAGFHGATFAAGAGDLTDAHLPVAFGKASGATCSTSANGSPDVSASFSPTGAYAYLTVAGSTGMVAIAPAPAFDAGRTQLSWTVTNPAFAAAFDCVQVGPLYGNVRSTASHPTSTYSSGCDCWTAFTRIDELTGEASGDSSLPTLWFPGRQPKATLVPVWQPLPKMATQVASIDIASKGATGTDADATVTWFRGAAKVSAKTQTIAAGKSATFAVKLAKAGTYRVEVSNGTAVIFKRSFVVSPKIAKPVVKKFTAKETKTGVAVSYTVCAPRGRLHVVVGGASRYAGTTLATMEKNFKPFHAGGCRVYSPAWRASSTWRGTGSRKYTVRAFDRFEQVSALKAVTVSGGN